MILIVLQKKFDYFVDEVGEITGGEIYVRLFNGAMRPLPEMYFSDFDLRTTERYKSFQPKLKEEYFKFMTNIFGEDYKQDLTKHYQAIADNIRNL